MRAMERKGRRTLQVFFLVLLSAAYAYFQVWRPLMGLHSNDFKHIYLGMQAIWEGGDPYGALSLLSVARDHGLGHASLNPYVYLPFTGIVLGFMKPLAFPSAALLWFAINHILLLATILICSYETIKIINNRGGWLGVFNLLLLCAVISHPLSRTLTAGQLNLVLMLCYAAAFALMARGRDVLAGAILGFAALFKIAPGFFLLHWVLVRRWRAFWAMAVTSVGLFAASVAIVGLRMHLDFLPMLRQMGYGRSTWEEYGATFWKDPWNQSINSLLTHLFVSSNRITLAWYEGTQTLANALTWVVSLALLGCYGFVAWTATSPQASRAACAATFDLSSQGLYMAALFLTLLLPSLLWDHYLVILILPVAWLAAVACSQKWWGVFITCVGCYLATAIPIRFDLEFFRAGMSVLLMSAKLYPTLILYGLCLHASLRLKNACSSPQNAA